MLTPMRIVAVHDGGGCGWYRLMVPLTELGKHEGYDVELHSSAVGGYKALDFSKFDVVAGQRFDNFSGMAGWRRMRTGSNRLVYDNDDDVFSVNKENVAAYSAYADLSTRAAVQGYLTYSDAVTTTNKHLAEVLGDYCDNVKVLPNFIPERALQFPESKPEGMSIGYQGGSSHALDVSLAAPAVRRFIGQNKNWKLHIVGSDLRAAFRVTEGSYEFHDWTNITEDPAGFYQSLDFDIGICPLRDNRFNRSKSYIKALEYNSRGVPVIASNVGPYKDYVQHGVNGFLVKQDHEWGKYLNLLARDEDLRWEMGRAGRDIAAQHTIEKNWRLWADAYEGMFK